MVYSTDNYGHCTLPGRLLLCVWSSRPSSFSTLQQFLELLSQPHPSPSSRRALQLVFLYGRTSAQASAGACVGAGVTGGSVASVAGASVSGGANVAGSVVPMANPVGSGASV